MIGTFAPLVIFDCVYKAKSERNDKTPKIRQESIILHEDKDAEVLVKPESKETDVKKNVNQELIKLIEPTQNSESSSVNLEKVFVEKGKEARSGEKKSQEEKLLSNKRSEHQSLLQKTIKSEMKYPGREIQIQLSQQDDVKDSKTKSQMRTLGVLCQRRRSETSKLRKCSTAREKTREGFSKTQTREEEASTLEGVKSITRDEAPSVINQRKTLPKKR
ncbi:hypothetical protein X798_01658 [Onchocerca flexuosa]|uniref:Uncharacterized protein n=1 Tax=Onchocerca flexuosa TaxID=387005 RepID=A0A238C165_9BILA|nr:hypothetical protein X798_01658 [Onchocerca flexuosa]